MKMFNVSRVQLSLSKLKKKKKKLDVLKYKHQAQFSHNRRLQT